MPALRFYYSDTIEVFLRKPTNEIVGNLALAHAHDINNETSMSWVEEIDIMKSALANFSGRGSLYFEYNIPRMGRRADVIALIDGVVLVMEFKTSEQKFTRPSEIQVWDYALDLKNFQQGSRDRILIPILVAPKEQDKNCKFDLVPFEDNVYQPLLSNGKRLKECINLIVANIQPTHPTSKHDDDNWAKSGYDPTPTIIEAAVALYEEHNVADITKHDGDVEQTAQCINRIIEQCRTNRRKAICFVTGVPGAGKTLFGLQTAIDQFNKGEKAVYLSGNFPLVEVLQEALTRDYIRRSKADYQSGRTAEKPCPKAEAKSKVKAFIQMVHHYRDLYLERTKVEGDGAKLNQADFAMSKIAANVSYGRNMLRKAIDYFSHLAVQPEWYADMSKDQEFMDSIFAAKLKWLKDDREEIFDADYNDILRIAFMYKFGRAKMKDLVSLLGGRDFETREHREEIVESSFGQLTDGVVDFMNEYSFSNFVLASRPDSYPNGWSTRR